MNMLSAARNTASLLGCPNIDCNRSTLCFEKCEIKRANEKLLRMESRTVHDGWPDIEPVTDEQ